MTMIDDSSKNSDVVSHWDTGLIISHNNMYISNLGNQKIWIDTDKQMLIKIRLS